MLCFFLIFLLFFFFLRIRRPPRSTLDRSSAASDVYKRQTVDIFTQTRKTRSIQTVITLTQSLDLIDLHSLGWQDIAVVGKLERSGTRTTKGRTIPVSYTHLRAHETVLDLVCRLLLEKKKKNTTAIEHTPRSA